MRIKFFHPDKEQLPTSMWFLADRYPVMYEMVNRMTVRFYFYCYPKDFSIDEIINAANRVFCRQPEKYGNPRWKVKEIKELEQKNIAERVVQVKYEFDTY